MKKNTMNVCCTLFLFLLLGAADTRAGCEQGRILYEAAQKQGEINQRIGLLQESLAACEDFAVWYELAICYEKVERYQEAEDALKHARQTAGNNKAHARVLYRMGILYEKTDRPDQAYCFYDEACKKTHHPKAQARIKAMDLHRMEHGMSVTAMTKTLCMPSRAFGVTPSLNLYISFDSDEDQPNERGRAEASKLGQTLTDPTLAGNNFLLIGHTDSRGDDAYNLDLSRRRAQAVKAYLLNAFNIAPQCLEIRGEGESNLRYTPERSQQDYALNRRVEIRIK